MSVFKQLEKAINKGIKDCLRKENLKPLAEDAARIIRVRTRLGFGVKENRARRKKLKDISDKYKKERKKIREGKRKNKRLSNETTPGRSNLTFTGQMIDSLRGTAPKNALMEINVTGRRKENSDLTNDEIRKFQEEQGRTFLRLSTIELKQLTDTLRLNLFSCINKQIKRVK